MSSYNLTQYYGRSTRTGIVGAAQFLFGLGIGGEFQRQREQTRSALNQSVYLAGFGAGSANFGWYVGPDPFGQQPGLGTRTVYAIVSLPAASDGAGKLSWTAGYEWQARDGRPLVTARGGGLVPVTGGAVALPPSAAAQLRRLTYQTQYLSSLPAGASVAPGNDSTYLNRPTADRDYGFVQLDFENPVDPNLIITVNGSVLSRVHDFRGMATRQTLAGAAAPPTFGLLESDDSKGESWFSVSPRSVVLKISRRVAGTESFPSIRVIEPGNFNLELTSLIVMMGPCDTRTLVRGVHVGNLHFCGPGGAAPPDFDSSTAPTVLLPLFSEAVQRQIAVRHPADGTQIRISVTPSPGDPPDLAMLDENTRVLIPAGDGRAAALRCRLDDDLVCDATGHLPAGAAPEVLVERAGHGGLKGIFGSGRVVDAEREVTFDPRWTITPLRTPQGRTDGWKLSILGGAFASGMSVSPHPGYTSTVTAESGSRRTRVELVVPVTGVHHLLNAEIRLLDAHGAVIGRLPSPTPDLFSSRLEFSQTNDSIALIGAILAAATVKIPSCAGALPERLDPKTHKPVQPRFTVTQVEGFATVTHIRSLHPGIYPIALQVGDVCLAATDKDNKPIALNVPEPEQQPAQTAAAKKPASSKPAGETLTLSAPTATGAAGADAKTHPPLIITGPGAGTQFMLMAPPVDKRNRTKSNTAQ